MLGVCWLQLYRGSKKWWYPDLCMVYFHGKIHPWMIFWGTRMTLETSKPRLVWKFMGLKPQFPYFSMAVNGPKCCPICGHTRVLNHGNSKQFAKQQDLPKPRVVSRHQRNIWMSNDQTVPDTLISVQITTSSGTILFLSLAEHSKENNMIWQTSFQSTVRRIKRLQANPVFKQIHFSVQIFGSV